MQESKQQNEFEDLQRDFRRVDTSKKRHVDWLHKIGPTQTNLFQVRSRGVRYLAGLRSETEAKRVLSQLSVAVRRNAV